MQMDPVLRKMEDPKRGLIHIFISMWNSRVQEWGMVFSIFAAVHIYQLIQKNHDYTCSVEGLLGVTVDEREVFLININEIVTEDKSNKQVTICFWKKVKVSFCTAADSNTIISHSPKL